MSIRFFQIEIPVIVQEGEDVDTRQGATMTVRIAMGAEAKSEDAVRMLAEKLESVCNTMDV